MNCSEPRVLPIHLNMNTKKNGNISLCIKSLNNLIKYNSSQNNLYTGESAMFLIIKLEILFYTNSSILLPLNQQLPWPLQTKLSYKLSQVSQEGLFSTTPTTKLKKRFFSHHTLNSKSPMLAKSSTKRKTRRSNTSKWNKSRKNLWKKALSTLSFGLMIKPLKERPSGTNFKKSRKVQLWFKYFPQRIFKIGSLITKISFKAQRPEFPWYQTWLEFKTESKMNLLGLTPSMWWEKIFQKSIPKIYSCTLETKKWQLKNLKNMILSNHKLFKFQVLHPDSKNFWKSSEFSDIMMHLHK